MQTKFDRTFRRLTDKAQTEVLALLAAFEAGTITQGQFERDVAVVISRNQIRGARLGDIGMAALLGTAPLGLPASFVDQPRARKAVRTLLDARPTSVDLIESRELRFARYARSETSAQVHDTMQTSMRQNNVARWVRQTDNEPCPLCTELADGVARPVSVRMTRHEGCLCWPRPA